MELQERVSRVRIILKLMSLARVRRTQPCARGPRAAIGAKLNRRQGMESNVISDPAGRIRNKQHPEGNQQCFSQYDEGHQARNFRLKITRHVI